MPVGLALIGFALAGALAAPAGAPAPLWPADDDATRDLASRDDGLRLRAVLELALLDAPRATALLRPALADRDPSVRLAAARLLARRGAKEATDAAVAWLATRATRERFLGLLVLRQVSELTPEARRATERALREGDLQARVQALEVLATFPAPSSFGAVVAALDDELSEVRLRAVRVLEAMHDARATVPLLERVADGELTVRDAALGALGASGDRRVLPALLRQVAEGAREPRTAAVDALARLGDLGALPALTVLARRRPRDDLARHAALALGTLGAPEAVETLLALAREPPGADDLGVALERAGARAVPRLCRELETGSPTSARVAAEVLGRLGDRHATAALVDVATRGRTGTMLAAFEALARLADPAAVPGLVRVVESAGVAELRGLALDALVAIGDERALEAVPRALADPDAGVRARGVRLAATLGGATGALAGRLVDPEAEVRREAARALGRAPSLPPEAAAPILAALTRAEPPLDDGDARALGDALERLAVEPRVDPRALERAYLAATVTAARAALARALATARVPPSGAVASALLRDLTSDDGLAGAAADALARVALSRDQQAAVAVVFARAAPALAARLAPALSRFGAGAGALEAALADDRTAPVLRAAAAWALADVSDARGALRLAANDADAAVAGNARAALAVGARRGATSSSTAARLTAADGAAWPSRWVTVTAAGGVAVWVMTDPGGRASVAGLPEGPLTLRAPTE